MQNTGVPKKSVAWRRYYITSHPLFPLPEVQLIFIHRQRERRKKQKKTAVVGGKKENIKVSLIHGYILPFYLLVDTNMEKTITL